MDVDKYDDDLDSSTSPTNLKEESPESGAKPKPDDSEETDTSPAQDTMESELEVKENHILNPYNHSLGFSIGSFKNQSNFVFNGESAGGFSVFYSSITDRNLFFKKKYPQDSLSIEGGFTYYNLNNVNGHNDDYTLLPIKIDLRYDVYLSTVFGTFFYFGAQYNWVTTTDSVDIANSVVDLNTYNKLHGFALDTGFGIFYNIGPQWYLRGDIGLDRMALGLSVKW